jgi:uncharacterized protein (TIGR02246 family)
MSLDVIAIEQLLNRYCHKLDGGDVAAVMALFADDAVLLPEYEGSERYQGREAIEAWYRRYSTRAGESVRGLRHKISTAMIDVDGDHARSVCYLDADSVDPSTGARSLAGGRYEDELVRRDGVWLIYRRRIVVDYASTLS